MHCELLTYNGNTGKTEFVGAFSSFSSAVKAARDSWMEEERGEQTLSVHRETSGRLLAVLTRPVISDPELCLTLTFEPDGLTVLRSLHRCHYVTADGGRYVRTEVTRVDAEGSEMFV